MGGQGAHHPCDYATTRAVASSGIAVTARHFGHAPEPISRSAGAKEPQICPVNRPGSAGENGGERGNESTQSDAADTGVSETSEDSSGTTHVGQGGRLSVGENHSCALTLGGALKCRGRNYYGQLGTGTTDDESAPANVVSLNSDVAMVTTGPNHTCALMADGGVRCWGSDSFGQLGNGSDDLALDDCGRPQSCSLTAVNVEGLPSDIIAISAGERLSCVLASGGGVWCWGDREHAPAPVEELGRVLTSLAVGGEHSCVRTLDGALECWGENNQGQLGHGSGNAELQVESLGTSVRMFGAGYDFTCAATKGGELWCWGDNHDRQLGLGKGPGDQHTPARVLALGYSVVAVALGYDHSCALRLGGAVECWGSDLAGKLGNGIHPSDTQELPTPVKGLDSGVIEISAGRDHTCVVMDDTSNRCWGADQYGQLGNGRATGEQQSPMTVLFQ